MKFRINYHLNIGFFFICLTHFQCLTNQLSTVSYWNFEPTTISFHGYYLNNNNNVTSYLNTIDSYILGPCAQLQGRFNFFDFINWSQFKVKLTLFPIMQIDCQHYNCHK